jgi:hypothetical protein
VPGSPPADHAGARAEVDAVFDGLLAHLIATSPVAATQLGDHSRDADLDDWPAGEADRRLRAVSDLRARLDAVPDDGDPEVAGDKVLVGDALDGIDFELRLQRAHETDPLFYLGLATASVDDLIRRDDLPAAPRAAAAAARAAQVPRLLEQAAATLREVSQPHRRLALLRLPGAIQLFGTVLPEFLRNAEDSNAADVAAAAVAACRDFGAFLEAAQGPYPDWRLGPQRWAQALRLALGVRMPPDELQRRAEAAFAQQQERMQELAAAVLGPQAAGLTGTELVRAGVAAASTDVSDRGRLVQDAAGVLDEVKDFIRDHGDFDVPEPDTLKVEEVPPFMQGSVVAYFMPAPPLETGAAHTYYLSPVPQGWDSDRAGSFLREYNVHALRSVGIHEAYPGHYVQQVHAHRHPRLLRRVLWNSAFAEGWAVYAEQQLIAAGFRGSGQEGHRMRLISAKMELRSTVNALLDQGMHLHEWSDETAMDLMVAKAYQESAEAEAKLLRAKTSAGQLSTYFVGVEEMNDLRRDVTAAHGDTFDVARFHNQVLAQGTPPFEVLRTALLKETAA